jgi:hypothetical protein
MMAFSLLAACAEPSGDAARQTGSAPARSGDVAIGEELEAARAAGTPAAYRLFLARHPNHALAPAAREELRKLEQLYGH